MNKSNRNPQSSNRQRNGNSARDREKLLQQKIQEEAQLKKRVRYLNKEYAFVKVFFELIFCSLIVYVIYFNVAKSQEFINSPYNTRQKDFSEKVIRGNIESSDGQLLAYTYVSEDGSEERIYPYKRVFSHAVGYDVNGRSGLESEGNFQLLSSHSFMLKQFKNQINGKKNMGDTLVSTLDTTIQRAAYDALGDRYGAVIALEPSTGKVLAMVSKPDFDPNTIAQDWDAFVNNSSSSNLLNRVTNGQYPPGSVFKIATALDYYREKGDMSRFSYDCEGSVTMSGHSINCYHGNVHGHQNMDQAFANSCNTAFAAIGTELGASSLISTCEDLLFNKKLPLSNSKKSSFSLKADSPVPLIMQTSIGQGNTMVSPLHMALITSAIANHGVLMEPHLISAIKNDEGYVVDKIRPKAYKRLMTKEEASILDKMMKGVVSSGTATSLSGRAYSVAGKTGSAEFDSNGNSHSWFVGYCGKEKTDMVVAVIVENGGTGSAAAVPIAGTLFDAYYQSQAVFDTEYQNIDYSDYEDSAIDETDNGWFDIVEEEYQEYPDYSGNPSDSWEQIYGEHPDNYRDPMESDYYDPEIPEVGDPGSGFDSPDYWWPEDIPELNDPGNLDGNNGNSDLYPERDPEEDWIENWEEESFGESEDSEEWDTVPFEIQYEENEHYE